MLFEKAKKPKIKWIQIDTNSETPLPLPSHSGFEYHMESFRPSRGSKIRDWGTRGSNQKDRFRPEHRSPGLGNLSCSGVRWGGKSSKVELRFVWLVSLEGRFECVGVFPRGNPKQLSTSLGSS